ncbi:MAG: tRNA (adenosine(37)-N6)-threonylcarbamoyltransferase complex ATPase subunit type 1 TsaE [Pseudomonadota bacterium]
MAEPLLRAKLPTEDDTHHFAGKIAAGLAVGDTLLLSGPVGAGKSAFARAVIRHRLGRMEDVPSPTFTLVQTYEDPEGDIWHCDLYRLGHPDEAWELGLAEAFETAICLIEWPDRLGHDLPAGALSLTFAAGPDAHEVTVKGGPAWAARLDGLHV